MKDIPKNMLDKMVKLEGRIQAAIDYYGADHKLQRRVEISTFEDVDFVLTYFQNILSALVECYRQNKKPHDFPADDPYAWSRESVVRHYINMIQKYYDFPSYEELFVFK